MKNLKRNSKKHSLLITGRLISGSVIICPALYGLDKHHSGFRQGNTNEKKANLVGQKHNDAVALPYASSVRCSKDFWLPPAKRWRSPRSHFFQFLLPHRLSFSLFVPPPLIFLFSSCLLPFQLLDSG